MMSYETIRDLENRAAVDAFLEGVEPYQPMSAREVAHWRRIPFPNMGSYRPEGWRLVDSAFVDKTGWDESGPAMSVDELKDWVIEKMAVDNTAGFGLVEEGQFQLYVGYFTQDDEIQENEDAYLPSGFEVTEDSYFNCPECGATLLADDTYCESCGWDKDEEDEAARLAAAPFHKDDEIQVWASLMDASVPDVFAPVWVTVTEVDVDAETIDVEDEDGNQEFNIPWTANGIIK